MTQDKTLTCRECSVDFIFTSSEQDFYAEKGLTNEPGRCPECRAARKRKGTLPKIEGSPIKSAGDSWSYLTEPEF